MMMELNQNDNKQQNKASEIHYAQIFFVVGHVSIKMLTYIEQIENELKKSGSETAFVQKQNRESEDNKAEEELDNIVGGKDAEIEEYIRTLRKIIEE